MAERAAALHSRQGAAGRRFRLLKLDLQAVLEPTAGWPTANNSVHLTALKLEH